MSSSLTMRFRSKKSTSPHLIVADIHQLRSIEGQIVRTIQGQLNTILNVVIVMNASEFTNDIPNRSKELKRLNVKRHHTALNGLMVIVIAQLRYSKGTPDLLRCKYDTFHHHYCAQGRYH